MRLSACAPIVIAASVLAACNSPPSSTETTDQCTGTPFTMTDNEVTTIPATDAPCATVPADGATYIVTPQYGSGVGPTSTVGYEIGAVAPPQQDRAPYVMAGNTIHNAILGRRGHGLQEKFDYGLRERERAIAASGHNITASQRRPTLSLRTLPVSITDTFEVCNNLSCTSFKLDTATLKYQGNHIMIFVSNRTPAGGFTAGQITAMGNTFDTDLYPIDTVAFGAPSDLDGNGRVIVLMTPYVNAITPSNQCATLGFVAGFFYGNDLTNAAFSNHGEIFYSLVPDSLGTFSCIHSAASIGPIILPTFIHEFQHMISWNQHVILRPTPGTAEETWLNEGMSHIAEELGSRYYENKYPISCGCMRTDPSQIFPDSAEGFISGDLENSYSFLQSSPGSSITQFASSGSLEERGGAWLFLRWLADQKDSLILGKIDQTSLTGVDNIATQAGEPFEALFGDFTAAVFGDSLPGFPRNTVVARDRFVSRNLRQIYNRLFTTSGGSLPTAFPVVARTMPVGGKATSTMLIGTMEYWKLTMPSSGGSMQLHFAKQGGGTFPSSYTAQLSILRCPSAAACP
jgi:hypothetical protein